MESKTMRVRVNVDISVKGVRTWSCTCEGEGYTQEHILRESDRLVKSLEQRYPPTGKEEKEVTICKP